MKSNKDCIYEFSFNLALCDVVHTLKTLLRKLSAIMYICKYHKLSIP